MFSPSGIYELVDTLWRRGQSVGLVVGSLVGALVGSSICWFICRHVMPSYWKGKAEHLREEKETLVRDRAIQRDQIEELTKDHEVLQQLNSQYVIRIKAAETSLDHVSRERNEIQRESATCEERLLRTQTTLSETGRALTLLHSEIKALKENARKGWIDPPGESSPPFRSLHSRQMAIISVVNLKGGVGKTTITANLGATLARRGLRVLMADLDYQGSLTTLCLSGQELQDVRQSRRLVEDIFRNETTDRVRSVFQCATRLEDIAVGPAYLLGTEETLDAVESEVMAPWLLRISNDDIRYRLRVALHSPAIQHEYDIVLLDCPPRLSTTCVNALAASDFVLIPVLPEITSMETAPQLLKWIRKFRSSFCPELAILGFVANRVTMHLGKPISRQQDIWNQLKEQCREVWGQHLRFFDEAMIPKFNELSHRLAALSPGRPEAVMNDLANVILKELPPYACHPAPAIHPIAHSAAPGVRS